MRRANYSRSYSEPSLLKKLAGYSAAAGKEVVEKVLTLFEALKDKDTPGWARATIIAALGYFIAPIDAIPDLIPAAGYTDDLGALALALATVAAHVKNVHVAAAKKKVERWFGS